MLNATETGISSGLVSQLAQMQTFLQLEKLYNASLSAGQPGFNDQEPLAPGDFP